MVEIGVPPEISPDEKVDHVERGVVARCHHVRQESARRDGFGHGLRIQFDQVLDHGQGHLGAAQVVVNRQGALAVPHGQQAAVCGVVVLLLRHEDAHQVPHGEARATGQVDGQRPRAVGLSARRRARRGQIFNDAEGGTAVTGNVQSQ